MTQPDIASIAAGLTETQRRYLLESYYGRGGWRIVGYRKAMCDKGLCAPNSSIITPLGMTIKYHLHSQGKQP